MPAWLRMPEFLCLFRVPEHLNPYTTPPPASTTCKSVSSVESMIIPPSVATISTNRLRIASAVLSRWVLKTLSVRPVENSPLGILPIVIGHSPLYLVLLWTIFDPHEEIILGSVGRGSFPTFEIAITGIHPKIQIVITCIKSECHTRSSTRTFPA